MLSVKYLVNDLWMAENLYSENDTQAKAMPIGPRRDEGGLVGKGPNIRTKMSGRQFEPLTALISATHLRFSLRKTGFSSLLNPDCSEPSREKQA
jgi:hypothetical protein